MPHPNNEPAPPARAQRWTAGAAFIACAAILAYRKADSLLNPQFWAEEGPIYYGPALMRGARLLFFPYEGNLYVIHRAIAYGATLVPVAYAPAFFNYAAYALNLAVIGYLLAARIGVRATWLLALAAVLVPHTGEVLVNMVNLHWVLALAMLVMAVSEEPRTRLGKFAQGGALLLTALDGPFIILFGPLFLVRALRRRTLYSFGLASVVCFGVLSQFGLLSALAPGRTFAPVYTHRIQQVGGSFDPADPDWLGFWGNCLSGILLLGRPLTSTFPNSSLMSLLSFILLGGLAAYVFWRPSRVGFTFLWGIGVCLAAVALIYSGHPGFATVSPGFRYSYIPFVCIAWLFVLLTERSRVLALPAWGMLSIMLASSLTYFQAPPLPDLHWAEASVDIGGPNPCMVDINPSPWKVYYLPPRMVPPLDAPGRAPELPSEAYPTRHAGPSGAFGGRSADALKT